MKKIILFLAGVLFFYGCEKNYDTVIDNNFSTYRVSSISSFNEYLYSIGDSVMSLKVTFSNDDDVKNVYCNIYSSENNKLNGNPLYLNDNGENGDVNSGDKTYTTNFPMQQSFPNGQYEVHYYVTDVNNSTNKIAIQNFTYFNGTENKPPVVSNLSAPDTVTIGSDTTYLQITLDVEDENGLNDIEFVFFNAFLPNGNPSGANPIQMYDDGDIVSHGDETANDGRYSVIIILPPTGVTTGTYRWEFQARDRVNTYSNKIVHNVVIQ